MVKLTADIAARALIAAARTYDFDVLQVFIPHKPNANRVRSLAAAGCATALGGRRQDYARAFRVHPGELSKAEALAGRGLADLIDMLRWNAQAAPRGAATPDRIAPPPAPEPQPPAAPVRTRKRRPAPEPIPAPRPLTVLPGQPAPSLKPVVDGRAAAKTGAGVPLELGPGDDRLVERVMAAGGLPTAAVIKGRTVWLGPDNTEWRAKA